MALRVGAGGGGRAVAATLKGFSVFVSVGFDIWTMLLIPHGCTVFSQLQCKYVCVHRTCVHGLSGGGASGSASHREAVKVPGGGLSGLSGSGSARLIVGTAGTAEARKGRIHNTDMKTRVHACTVAIVHMNST